MYGRHVATLTRARDRLSLAYTEEAQDTYDVNTPLLSISLPVGPQAFPHDRARPFFEGLLPEGETRRVLAYDFRLQEDDIFGLLGVLGRDCAGALIILPEGEAPPDPRACAPTSITQQEVVARLRRLSIEPLGVDEMVRVSLAGVQQKMVLSRLPAAVTAAAGDVPTVPPELVELVTARVVDFAAGRPTRQAI
jgi:serine/threonine-protein kinase HipA